MKPYVYKFDIQVIGAHGGCLIWFPNLPGIMIVRDDVAETVERAHDAARVTHDSEDIADQNNPGQRRIPSQAY